MDEVLHLPSPAVIVLVGPGASGKSTWAQAHFPPEAIVSSDHLRAVVGAGEDDVAASEDAFELLDRIVARRMARRLTTVIDTLGLDRARRLGWLEAARAHRLPCVVVGFDTPAQQCRERNRGRAKRIPASVLAGQLRSWSATRDLLDGEGFDLVLRPLAVRVVPAAFVSAGSAALRQQDRPAGLRFGLHLSSYTWPGGAGASRDRLRRIAAAAEQAGFDALYVMDHFRQIPQVGRAWEDFLDSYTTLGYLAACTERVRLGTLVTGITYRNVGHLGKIVATLDVLSGGRAICGVGLAWHREEHEAYGWEFPPVGRRYTLLEDALRVLPMLWGRGTPAFEGEAIRLPETLCYPRPLQEHVPLLVGGGGERRTLRLAARYADGCNVMGDLATVRRKAAVLRAHCAELDRDPTQVDLTHLSTVLVAEHDAQLGALVERLRPRRQSAAQFAAAVNAGTVADHVGRFRELAEAGVAEVMVRLVDLGEGGGEGEGEAESAVERMAAVIRAFR